MRKILENHLHLKTIASFFLTLLLCSVLITVTVINRSSVEKLAMEQLILEKSSAINEVISKLLYKTHSLSALVIQNNGQILDFSRVAATIVDDPAILNILMAPDGIVTHVYPLEGNEAVIGLDFFSEGAGNKEAALAKERGELVFGGPFELVQGGQALVGRLPVYLDLPNGGKSFWGLVSVTLRYPEALEGARLQMLAHQGFAYEIWRINPDTNEKQIIANSDHDYNKNARYIERHIPILNADWFCRISPVRNWYEYPETWILSIISLLMSLLVAYVMQNNSELNLLKSELENLARMDPLTEVFNRRYFMELADMRISHAFRTNSKCFIVMLDLDYFKSVNDMYGHQAGDEALKAIAGRIKHMIRSYDLLARYGGEEFILLVTEIDEPGLQSMVERLRRNISDIPVPFDGFNISISASFGVAHSAPVNTLEAAIKLADQALYRAKEEGRNRVVLSWMLDASALNSAQ